MTSSTDNRNEQIKNYPGIDQVSIPSAAQLKREAVIRSEVITNLNRAFNYRLKAVELAAQFKSEDPMKLAMEIYKFLSETEV